MPLSPMDLIATTFRDLKGNWVRSSLTALGIFMGVAAVNATLNIDAITTAQIQQKLAQRDQPLLYFFMFDPTDRKPDPVLTEDVLVKMQQEVPGIRGISRTASIFSVNEVRYQDQVVQDVNIRGAAANFQETVGRQVIAGRFFQQTDFDEYYPVAVINSVMADRLFHDVSPINQGIFLDTIRVTVIGVLETKQFRADREPEAEVWLTENYGNAISGRNNWGNTLVVLEKLENYETVQEGLEAFLKQQYPDFEVRTYSNATDLFQEEQQQRASARILKVVGLLALVIGGVGIANITVASVMERTREIGLRRAIGATDWEVMVQFVTEAAVLSLIGGTTAIAAIHGLTQFATTRVFEAPYTFRMQDAAISMGAAFVVGVGASFLPALRVTQIDVVQALRGD